MAKGYKGQSCAVAIKACFQGVEGPLSYSKIFAKVKEQGTWKDTTIWRHLMSTVVNLIPARYEWANEKFLFLRPDGQYEIYDNNKHPKPIE
jgi:hypothetical protein